MSGLSRSGESGIHNHGRRAYGFRAPRFARPGKDMRKTLPIDLAKAPSFRLDGKRALVTGGGRGIGLTAASALAAAGAHVTLAARTRSEIEEAAAAIRARGEQAEALTLDVTDIQAVRHAIAAAAPFQILITVDGSARVTAAARHRVRRVGAGRCAGDAGERGKRNRGRPRHPRERQPTR